MTSTTKSKQVSSKQDKPKIKAGLQRKRSELKLPRILSSEDPQCLQYLNDDSEEEEDNNQNFAVDIYGNRLGPSREVIDQKEASRRHKMQVIRRLIKEFDLQETMDRYLCMSAKEYRIDVNQFSSQCSLSAIALRQRLIDLTGTDIIRMNDPKYMEELRRKRQIEYETRLDREEEERAEMESVRMRRMLKDGVISFDELKEDPLFLQEYNRSKMKYGRTRPNRRRHSPSKTKRAQTASGVESRTRDEGRSKTLLGNKPSDCPPPQNSRPSRVQERPRTVHWESRQDRLRYKEERQTEDGDIDYSRWSCYNKYKDPLIIKLQDEETVGGLYDVAEEILDGILPSQRGNDRQGKKLT